VGIVGRGRRESRDDLRLMLGLCREDKVN
jgi:hypothetical protein